MNAILKSATILSALSVIGPSLLAAPPAQKTAGTFDLGAASLKPGQQDAAFQRPFIDRDEWREGPIRHRYVHGGFRGSDTRFSFYFPERTAYQGRFFQHVTPTPDSENLAQREWKGEEDTLAFALTSGAYYVETNGGGSGRTALATNDPTITAYRANAAAAQFSRVVAAKVYASGKRPFGYIYGGSGGAYRSIGSIENTSDVWDGAVPYVVGSTMALPNVFTVRLHAMRVLWDKFPQINDALDAGGSGEPYAGLNEEEAAALREATRMGFPPQSWFAYKTMGVHGFAALYPGLLAADPTYFTDFWTKPGYLGARPPASLVRARVVQPARFKGLATAEQGRKLGIVKRGADGGVDNAFLAGQDEGIVGVRLDQSIKADNFLGGDLIVNGGAAAGSRIQIREIRGDVAVLGVFDKAVVDQLRADDAVRVDNSDFLAAQTYHRHQVPGPEFRAWDQFRKPDGTPLYPQRPNLIAPSFVKASAGALPTGKIHGKVIVVASLWDREAFPWQADWYRQKVVAHLGGRADDSFRLWYTEHALHGDETRQEDSTRTVSYIGVLHQALRDLSAWVERGVAPPESTRYAVNETQIVVPATAAQRRGIQPVVTLRANGGERAAVRVGEPVRLTAITAMPPGAGSIVEAKWDMLGKGDYPITAELSDSAKPNVTLSTTYRFTKAGTYFPTLRVAGQREGDARAPFARTQNLARVRVVVR